MLDDVVWHHECCQPEPNCLDLRQNLDHGPVLPPSIGPRGAGPRHHAPREILFVRTQLGGFWLTGWLTLTVTLPKNKKKRATRFCAYEQGGYPIHACYFSVSIRSALFS